jgi:hypothetical protein
MTNLTRQGCRSILALAFIALFGCHQPIRPTEPTTSAIDESELDSLWSTSLSVLQKHDFQPDRRDRAQGVITTLPTTSMQWGEFWRQDVADSYSYGEASLHTIQRQATIRFIKDGGWRVEVQVDVYRLSMPDSQITSASSCLQSFSGVIPDASGSVATKGTPRRTWTKIGRDGAMEQRLLNRILASSGA